MHATVTTVVEYANASSASCTRPSDTLMLSLARVPRTEGLAFGKFREVPSQLKDTVTEYGAAHAGRYRYGQIGLLETTIQDEPS
jgi:hypothetical protein